jgi:Arginine dihydrolase ArgZ-like, C-terminal, Rossmann fold
LDFSEITEYGDTPMIDFSAINTYPIKERRNKFSIKDMIPLDHSVAYSDANIESIAQSLLESKTSGHRAMIMLGGAVVKVGCSHLLIDLMKRGYIQHLAVNGAVSIHDFEVALIGETSEDVERGLEDGTFGMVEETGKILNQAINEGYAEGRGYGESVGAKIHQLDLPYKEFSLFYQAYRLKIPVTVHIAIGGDIIHQHPSCNGAALGATSFQDFKLLTEGVSGLKKGVLLNIGSAVNLPEAFLKALTIARNLGFDVRDFSAANFDFIDMYRPRTRLLEWPKKLGCKTYDIRGNHNRTLPLLHKLIGKAG